jgi:sec-independent protein translocase protein TatA
MPSLGAPELLIVLAIVVVLFGASRIPEIMGGMGKGIREFKRATKDEDDPSATHATKLDESKTKLEEPTRDAV